MKPSNRSKRFLSRSAYLGLWLLAGGLALTASALASPWAKVKTTAPGPVQVIGSTSNGCVAGAQPLEPQGAGYVSIRRHRNRYYGHPELLGLVRDLGRALSRRTDDLLMVGDLSQPRGGLMSSSHRSHQNGLDVDIWFPLAASARDADRQHPEQRDPPSMVNPGARGVNPLWGEHQRFLIKATAEDRRVDRIFVNPAIKQSLCEKERGERGWLRKLRPWSGHDAHFHVRLKCPAGSLSCVQQAPLPAGEGCGADLAWWFSDEARSPKKKGAPKPPAPMPTACRALLAGY